MKSIPRNNRTPADPSRREFLIEGTVAAFAAALPAPGMKEGDANLPGEPYNAEQFESMRVTDTWKKYADKLTWGKGQCLAVLDDGCDLIVPQWKVVLPWGRKEIATHDSIDGDDDPSPVPPGYHGTTMGYPSSLNFEGTLGIAFNNYVAHVRCVSVVHLRKDESKTMAAGLQWVIDHHRHYNITTVNLSPVDDQRHREPVPTGIDEKLEALRKLGVWVSAPCGNNHYADGISWPACQPCCFAIGATVPLEHQVHLDRFSTTALLVAATATSSSNGHAAGCSMILREAIEKADYDWKRDGATLPDAMMAIFQKTGHVITDPQSGLTFRELDLLAAVDHVFAPGR
ncbi:MAG: hypothetical protein HY736_18855 [Verrucomicrobia bacterium]|nr:hypothetical protein [Verrucomicrobiota bacterium]